MESQKVKIHEKERKSFQQIYTQMAGAKTSFDYQNCHQLVSSRARLGEEVGKFIWDYSINLSSKKDQLDRESFYVLLKLSTCVQQGVDIIFDTDYNNLKETERIQLPQQGVPLSDQKCQNIQSIKDLLKKQKDLDTAKTNKEDKSINQNSEKLSEVVTIAKIANNSVKDENKINGNNINNNIDNGENQKINVEDLMNQKNLLSQNNQVQLKLIEDSNMKEIQKELENLQKQSSKDFNDDDSSIEVSGSKKKEQSQEIVKEKQIEQQKGQYKSIQITRYTEKSEGYFSQKYIVFAIQFQEYVYPDNNKDENTYSYEIERRFSQFTILHEYLIKCGLYDGFIIPSLPSQQQTKIGSFLGSNYYDKDFLEKRRSDLEIYLNFIIQHETIQKDSVLEVFLKKQGPFEVPASPIQNQNFMNQANQLLYDVYAGGFQGIKQQSNTFISTQYQEIFSKKQELQEDNIKEIADVIEIIDKYEKSSANIEDLILKQIQCDQAILEANSSMTKNYSPYQVYNEIDEKLLNTFKFESTDLLMSQITQSADNIQTSIENQKELALAFRQIVKRTTAAKQSYNVLIQKFKENRYLNKLREVKVQYISNDSSSSQEIIEERKKINQLEGDIENSKKNLEKIKTTVILELNSFVEQIRVNFEKACHQMKASNASQFKLSLEQNNQNLKLLI